MKAKDGARASGGECPVCLKTYSYLECHHIIPRATAKANLTEDQGEGPLVNLCSTCHKSIHMQAKNYMGKNDRAFFEDVDEMERAAPFIRAIVLATRYSQENPEDMQPRELTLELYHKDIELLHLYKNQSGFKSLAKFTAYVLRDYLKKRLNE